MMDAAYLVAALAPSHVLHGPFEDIPTDIGKQVKCGCGAGLTFSPMQIATVLLFDEKQAEADKDAAKDKAVRRGA